MSHLLSLSALHAAAPGVLDIVFGPDGDFEGAPQWRPPLFGQYPPRSSEGMWGRGYFTGYYLEDGQVLYSSSNYGDVSVMSAALDCRVPSVAARLAGLCAKAAPDADTRRQLQIMFGDLRKPVSTGDAVALAALTLALAPKIAALGGSRV